MPIERIRIEQKPSAPRADGFAGIVFLRIFQIGLHTFGILAVGIIKMLPVLR